MASGAVRVLIVDDHPIVRRGLSQLIEQEPDLEVCGEADDADTALAAFVELEPDIALVDLMLQGASGTDLIKNLKAQNENIPILVISMHDEAVYAERALRAGAHGYIMKEEATGQVLTALRKVVGGDVYVSERMVGHLLRRMVGGAGHGAGIDGLQRPRAGSISVDRARVERSGYRGASEGQPQNGRELPRTHQGQAEPRELRRGHAGRGAVVRAAQPRVDHNSSSAAA